MNIFVVTYEREEWAEVIGAHVTRAGADSLITLDRKNNEEFRDRVDYDVHEVPLGT